MKNGNNPPKVSILLPNLNNRPFLAERMRSIVGQTFRDWELVVLDSHSTDGAWEFFQDWAGKDSRIRIMQTQRRGIYPNWNSCIRLAQGYYILIAPSDDTMEHDFLERMVQALDENPDCELAHCKLRIIDENGGPCPALNWEQLFSTKFFEGWIDRPHIRLAPFDGVLHCGVRTVYTSITQLLVRKRLFDRAGLFSTRFGSAADFEWGMRASLLANTVHVPHYLASWRVHSRQNTDINQLDAARQKRRFIKMVRHALRTARRIDPERVQKLRLNDLTYLYRKERWFAAIKEARQRRAPKPLPWHNKIGIGLNWLGHDPLILWEFFRQRKNTRNFLHPLSPLRYPREMLQKYGLTGHLVICPPREQNKLEPAADSSAPDPGRPAYSGQFPAYWKAREPGTNERKNLLFVQIQADLYGSSRSLLRLVRALDKTVYNPIVVLSGSGALKQQLELHGAKVIEIHHVGAVGRWNLFSWRFFLIPYDILKAARRLLQIMRRERIDLVHSNTSIILAAALAAKMARIPHIFHVREIYGEFPLLWKIHRRFIYWSSQEIICISTAVASQFSGRLVTVIHNGLDFASECRNLPDLDKMKIELGLDGGLLVGCIGRIKWCRKGQEVLVRAVALLKERGVIVHALIVGSPFPGNESHLRQLQALAGSLGVSGQMRFLGEQSDIWPFYALMDIFVMPSILPEPLGNVTMEAMAMGLPVIASRGGGTVELVADGVNGLLFRPGDSVALADKLAYLQQQPLQRREMGEAGRQRQLKEFHLGRCVGSIDAIYRRILHIPPEGSKDHP